MTKTSCKSEVGVHIAPFIKKDLDPIVDSLAESGQWTRKNAKLYCLQAFQANPELCLAATDNAGNLLGALFSKVGYGNKGKMLIIEAIQVMRHSRNARVGTHLLQEALYRARKKRLTHVGLMVPAHSLASSWLERLGLVETGWIELEAAIHDLSKRSSAP